MAVQTVLCGTYHRDHTGLERCFRELEQTGCRVLSPLSVKFVDCRPAVVRTAEEFDRSILELQEHHLRAMRNANFIWLHAPEGYSGISTSYELGYAKALRLPVFSATKPVDAMLACQVIVVQSVFEALEQL